MVKQAVTQREELHVYVMKREEVALALAKFEEEIM